MEIIVSAIAINFIIYSPLWLNRRAPENLARLPTSVKSIVLIPTNRRQSFSKTSLIEKYFVRNHFTQFKGKKIIMNTFMKNKSYRISTGRGKIQTECRHYYFSKDLSILATCLHNFDHDCIANCAPTNPNRDVQNSCLESRRLVTRAICKNQSAVISTIRAH